MNVNVLLFIPFFREKLATSWFCCWWPPKSHVLQDKTRRCTMETKKRFGALWDMDVSVYSTSLTHESSTHVATCVCWCSCRSTKRISWWITEYYMYSFHWKRGVRWWGFSSLSSNPLFACNKSLCARSCSCRFERFQLPFSQSSQATAGTFWNCTHWILDETHKCHPFVTKENIERLFIWIVGLEANRSQ